MSHHETYENDLESLELDGMLRTPHYHRYSIVDAVAEREGEVGSEGDVGVAVGGTLERRKALLEEVEGMLGRLNLEVAFDTVDVGNTVQHGEGEDNQGLEEEEEEDNQGLEEGEIPQSHSTPEDEEETEDGTDKAKKKKKKKAKKKRGGKKKSIVARQRGELETVMSASSSSSSLDGHVAKENVEDNLIGGTRHANWKKKKKKKRAKMMGYVHQPHAWCRNRCIGLGRNKLMRRWCAIGERGSVHSRRRMLLFGGTVSLVLDWNPQGGLVYANEMDQMQILESVARQAYGEREFQEAERALNELLDMSPNNVAYLEMRATTHVDKKDFEKALSDYDALLGLLREREGDSLNTARLLAGKALAFEGLYRFREAADAYEQSIQIAKNCGSPPDPYVENSLGNCYASLGKWKDARVQYLSSARGFQTSRVSNGRAGGMQRRLDGSIFAFSNAALMAVQLGDDDAALSEMKAIARRAPGSADMRAALAAMYWARGNTIGAESEWEFACNSISVGCAKYEDMDWLERVRRWPPRMIDYMKDFLALKSPEKDA